MENWIKIKRFENYEISTNGKVRNEKSIIKPIFKNGYNYVILDGKQKMLHKLMASMFLDFHYIGKEFVITHKDKNKLNNKLSNLKITSRRDVLVKKENSTSKYTGVSFNKKSCKWTSEIYVKGKRMHLGTFAEEKEAHEAYLKKRNELCTQ